LVLTISTVSVLGMRSIDKDLDKIVDDRWPTTVWSNEIIDIINVSARAFRNSLLSDISQSSSDLSGPDANLKGIVGSFKT